MQATTDTPNAHAQTGLAVHTRLEQLSAMVDEQASAQEIDQVLAACGDEPGLRNAWVMYQKVGEVMREGQHALPLASTAFSATVLARLEAEKSLATTHVRPVRTSAWQQPANDPVFRWKLVAGLASFAAVAAVLWQVVTPMAEPAGQWVQLAPSQQVQVAQTSQTPLSAEQAVLTAQGVLVRDPQLQALLEAHRQYGGQSALQMPAGFLRNATYELPQR